MGGKFSFPKEINDIFENEEYNRLTPEILEKYFKNKKNKKEQAFVKYMNGLHKKYLELHTNKPILDEEIKDLKINLEKKDTKIDKLQKEKDNLEILQEKNVEINKTNEKEKLNLEKQLLESKEEIKKLKEELEKRVDITMKEIMEEIEKIQKELEKDLSKDDIVDIISRTKILSSQWIIRNDIVEKESIDLRKKLNSHISTTDHYNHSMLSNRYKAVKIGFYDKLFRLIIKKKKEFKLQEDNRTLLRNFLKIIFEVKDEFVKEYIQALDPMTFQDKLNTGEKPEEQQKFRDWVEYGIIEFGKNKEKFIEKVKEKYDKIPGIFDDPILIKNLLEIFDISLKMRVATPKARFDFSDEGKEFNEDRNDTFNQNMETKGIIQYVILPTYIVKDGLSGEDRVFQKSIVFTDEKKEED